MQTGSMLYHPTVLTLYWNPLYLSVNKAAKYVICSQFREQHTKQVCNQNDITTWIDLMHVYNTNNHQVNGFKEIRICT